MTDAAASLMKSTEDMAFSEVGKPGIRAQLVERRNNALVMDFVMEAMPIARMYSMRFRRPKPVHCLLLNIS